MAARIFMFIALLSSFPHLLVASFKFDVGETAGWGIPPANDTDMYNDWASQKRFQVGDSVVFRYSGDSVMVVSEEEYYGCDATHPIHYYNDGDTVVTFDQPGFYYFISGLSSHCLKGERMIIKVMGHPNLPGASPPPPPGASSAVPLTGVSPLVLVQLSVFLLGFLRFWF